MTSTPPPFLSAEFFNSNKGRETGNSSGEYAAAASCRRRGWKQTIYTWHKSTKIWK